MKTIQVETGRAYPVYIGQGILPDCGRLLKESLRSKRAVIVTDDTVNGLYGKQTEESLRCAGLEVHTFAFPHGEGSKKLDTALEIINFLLEHTMTRTDVVVALGGGVVGDMAGFAASIYLRGIPYIQIPTTFLAAIDSSVGGKTAVNIPQGKNLLGSFYQPRMVICDTDTLDTLTEDCFNDGMAEALKYGCIWDEKLFSLMEFGGARKHLEAIIARCVQIKADVVAEDERDTGLRQILNFGHTLGHAIEKESGFSIAHGKGVAAGMVVITRASEQQGLTPTGTTQRLIEALERYSLPTSTHLSPEELASLAGGDKKRDGDLINLVVLDCMGKCRLHPVEIGKLAAFLS
ncbi:3-dehydroquinate synthase [Oscillospiraceae bacterium MB08-C2-2]|nr:3-dehydroquinate synthase [Oscillospiraceae bacterium MB08-C2-2]